MNRKYVFIIVFLTVMSKMQNLPKIYLKTFHAFTKNTNSKKVGPTHHYAFPKNVTKYQQLEQINLKNLPIPKNLHILFVGDSVTRYQYVSLAYFLKFGTWINTKHPIPIANNQSLDEMYQQPTAKEHVPHMGLIWKNFWNSKGDWSNYSNVMLSPFEKCDCMESNVKQWQRRFGVDEVENRYFRDNSRNNSLLYMKKLGDWNNHKIPLPFLSTWNIHEMNSMHNNKKSSIKSMASNGTKIPIGEYGLHTNIWTEFIQNFVVNLNPKPNVFVFNQGLWPHEQFQQPQAYTELINTISMAGMTSIYKTTSKWSDDDGSENELYEQEICKLTNFCIDLSWTLFVPKSLYADRAHFYEPVYSWMNVQLLSLILQNTS